MLIEKKEKYTLISSDENPFSEFYNAFSKKENGTSFVMVYNTINIDDFPENFNIVPTLIEAEDIIEMEAMERELGF